ncbi:MAG: DUF2339 domain-containing protein, partial [Candidatus Gracilibacteria bacterium]|nr:DUF2339 domain-containing protein [Candidatus Gracilibacteria bacterium]
SVWNQIPPVGKLIIGFIIGFGTYFTGVFLEKKGLSGESRILLGTGVLINFLVILAGKYIIGDDFTNVTVLTTGVTFFFLILNTIFGVVTSLVYKSRTLLLFSFIFAYINPFLTGGNADNPYTLIGYGLIISLGALFIGKKLDDDVLQYSAFIGGNLLFLFAPFQTEIGWIAKMVASGLLGVITILNLSQNKSVNLSPLFIGNYIFIILLLFAGGTKGILGSTGGFISYMLSIVLFFGIGVWFFLKNIFTSLATLLLFPIFIVLGLIFSGSMAFIAPALGIIVLVYLLSFYFLENTFPPYLKYLFFGLLGGFIFTVNLKLAITNFILPFGSFLTVLIITFVFLITAYFLSYKKDSGFLYSIGTLGA